MAFAGGRRGAASFHTGPRFRGDEGLWGPGVEEGDYAVTGDGGRTAVDVGSGGEGYVIDGNNTTQKAKSMFGEARRGTGRVCAGGHGGNSSAGARWGCARQEGRQESVERRRRGRSMSGCADLVYAVTGGGDAGGGWVGRGSHPGMEGIQLAADLHKDIAQKVESWPKRGSESSRAIRSDTDAPNKVIRASFGEDLVACVQKRLSQGEGGELGVVAPENDVAALSFPKLLVEVWKRNARCIFGARGPAKP